MPGIPLMRKETNAERQNTPWYRLVGAIIAALCCFTPVLVVLAGVIGLSAIVGYLDYVLLPALAFFIGLTLYALWRRNSRSAATTNNR